MSKSHRVLNEAISPGSQRAIKIDLSNYLDKINAISVYKHKLNRFMSLPHPAAVKDKVIAIEKNYISSIDKMESDLDKTAYAFLKGIRKNCSEFIEYYQNTGNIWKIDSDEISINSDVIYGKTPVDRKINSVVQVVEQQMLSSGLLAVPSNSILATRSYGKYYIFPVNGANYTTTDYSIYNMDINHLISVFKKYNALTQLKSLPSYDEFLERANIDPHFASEGFLNPQLWYHRGGQTGVDHNLNHKHLDVIKLMINEGKIPVKYMPLINPTFYFNDLVEEGYYKSFHINSHTTPEAVLISGSYYGIASSVAGIGARTLIRLIGNLK